MLKRNDLVEKAAIDLYCKKDKASVIERPNPPEAIIEYQNNQKKSWLEVTTIWQNRGQESQKVLAKALNNQGMKYEMLDVSPAAPNEIAYKFKCELIRSIQEKNSNSSYDPYVEKYGKGVLILVSEFISVTPRVFHQHPEITNFYFDELEKFNSIFLYFHAGKETQMGYTSSFPPELINLNVIKRRD